MGPKCLPLGVKDNCCLQCLPGTSLFQLNLLEFSRICSKHCTECNMHIKRHRWRRSGSLLWLHTAGSKAHRMSTACRSGYCCDDTRTQANPVPQYEYQIPSYLLAFWGLQYTQAINCYLRLETGWRFSIQPKQKPTVPYCMQCHKKKRLPYSKGDATAQVHSVQRQCYFVQFNVYAAFHLRVFVMHYCSRCVLSWSSGLTFSVCSFGKIQQVRSILLYVSFNAMETCVFWVSVGIEDCLAGSSRFSIYIHIFKRSCSRSWSSAPAAVENYAGSAQSWCESKTQ